jgi:hypothetical protein
VRKNNDSTYQNRKFKSRRQARWQAMMGFGVAIESGQQDGY